MKYEKRSQPPKELGLLIEAFNSLPADTAKQLDAIKDSWNSTMNEAVKAAKPEMQSETIRRLNAKYLERLQKALVTPAVKKVLSRDSVTFWDVFIELRWLLHNHATLTEVIKSYELSRDQPFGLGAAAKVFTFTDDGRVIPAGRMLAILANVSVDRIRICKMCETIFWAKKSNARTCSPDCATKLGNQKHLAGLKEKRSERTEADDAGSEGG